MRVSHGKGHGGPARGYSWPPFEPGNLAAVTHGARSPALVRERAEQLAPQVLEVHPHLDERRDGPAVMRYATLLARIERVYAWLGERADAVFADVESGEVHGVYQRLGEWERAAGLSEDRLGLSPLTRAKLGIDQLRAADLVTALAEAEQVGDRARARLAAAEDEDA